MDGLVLLTRFTDVLDDAQLLAYADEEIERGYLTAYKAELVDGREVVRHDTTVPGLEALAAKVRKAEDQLRGRRLAMVAGDDLTYGLFRMWELRREDLDYRVMVFRDYDKALAWLSVPLPLTG